MLSDAKLSNLDARQLTHSYLGLVGEKSKARLTKKHLQWLQDYSCQPEAI
jgi:hypothetical protein